MLVHNAATILVIAVAMSAASPIADSSDTDTSDDELEVEFDQDDDATMNTNPLSVAPTGPMPPIDPYLDLGSFDLPLDPFRGRFTGSNPGSSCGDQLAEGSTDAPLYVDCIRAMASWDPEHYYEPRFGRQTQEYGSCVVAWHPSSNDAQPLSGSDILMRCIWIESFCITRDFRYLTNYSYATMTDDTGTFSMYKKDDVPDGAPT